jgi:uncharacterized protein (DUF433 family)
LRKIVSHADVMSGKPHFVGTHVSIASIMQKIAQGMNIKQIVKQLPQISEEDVVVAIKFAEELVSKPF